MTNADDLMMGRWRDKNERAVLADLAIPTTEGDPA